MQSTDTLKAPLRSELLVAAERMVESFNQFPGDAHLPPVICRAYTALRAAVRAERKRLGLP